MFESSAATQKALNDLKEKQNILLSCLYEDEKNKGSQYHWDKWKEVVKASVVKSFLYGITPYYPLDNILSLHLKNNTHIKSQFFLKLVVMDKTFTFKEVKQNLIKDLDSLDTILSESIEWYSKRQDAIKNENKLKILTKIRGYGMSFRLTDNYAVLKNQIEREKSKRDKISCFIYNLEKELESSKTEDDMLFEFLDEIGDVYYLEQHFNSGNFVQDIVCLKDGLCLVKQINTNDEDETEIFFRWMVVCSFVGHNFIIYMDEFEDSQGLFTRDTLPSLKTAREWLHVITNTKPEVTFINEEIK